MSTVIGVGFIAMAGAGVWSVVTGEPFGVLPVIAGAGLAAAEFHEAAASRSSTN